MKWYNSYRWWWSRLPPKRPLTYWLRDTWVDYELLWVIALLAIGATLGECYGWTTILKILAIFATGVLFGHLFWGTPWHRGQKED